MGPASCLADPPLDIRDQRQPRLLRARPHRPSRRAAEKGDDSPAFHADPQGQNEPSYPFKATFWKRSGTAAPAASADRPLLFQLRASRCVAANSGSGP
jgi:hypothetical protein